MWDSYLFVRKDVSFAPRRCPKTYTNKKLQVSDILVPNAVVLRMARTSQEEAFLAAFCRVQEYPSLIVIKYVRSRVKIGVAIYSYTISEMANSRHNSALA